MADLAEETPVPTLAVTAAVGAVVLLFILLCGLRKKSDEEISGIDFFSFDVKNCCR